VELTTPPQVISVLFSPAPILNCIENCTLDHLMLEKKNKLIEQWKNGRKIDINLIEFCETKDFCGRIKISAKYLYPVKFVQMKKMDDDTTRTNR
jgi:hypothetical protein